MEIQQRCIPGGGDSGAHLGALAQPHVPGKGRVHLDDGVIGAASAGGGLPLAGHAGPSCVGAAGGGGGAGAGAGSGGAEGELDDDVLGGGAGVDEDVDEGGGQIEEAILEGVEGDGSGNGGRGGLAGGGVRHGGGGGGGVEGRRVRERGVWLGLGERGERRAAAGEGVLWNGGCFVCCGAVELQAELSCPSSGGCRVDSTRKPHTNTSLSPNPSLSRSTSHRQTAPATASQPTQSGKA